MPVKAGGDDLNQLSGQLFDQVVFKGLSLSLFQGTGDGEGSAGLVGRPKTFSGGYVDDFSAAAQAGPVKTFAGLVLELHFIDQQIQNLLGVQPLPELLDGHIGEMGMERAESSYPVIVDYFRHGLVVKQLSGELFG